MQPQMKIAPKKIGIQGPSIKKKSQQQTSSSSSSSSSGMTFTAEERAELRRLSAILPPAPRPTDPAAVVVHAANYIQQLVATIHARVKNGTLPEEMLASLPPMESSSSGRVAVRPRRSNKKRRSVEKKR